MKKLLSFTILFISHGLFGMDTSSTTEDNHTVELNKETTEVRYTDNATIRKTVTSFYTTEVTCYLLSNYPPSTDITLFINSTKIEKAHVDVTHLTAKKVSDKSFTNYTAIDWGHKTIISLNKKTTQERFIDFEDIFENAPTTTDID